MGSLPKYGRSSQISKKKKQKARGNRRDSGIPISLVS
jgi:hypothetical protein